MACRWFAALLALTLLAGCSNAFLYDRLDWLAARYVDDYVELDRAQKRTLAGLLDELHAWHRREELARYLALLDRIASDLDGPLARASVTRWGDQLGAAWQRLQLRALDSALVLSAQLEDAQMREFERALWQRQARWEHEYLARSDAEYTADQHEWLEDLLADLLGSLSRAQRDAIARTAARLERFDGLWLADRRAWLVRLGALLERPAGWQDALRQAVATREQARLPAYRRSFAHNRALIEDVVAEVLAGRDARQDAHLRDRLAALREDVVELLRKP